MDPVKIIIFLAVFALLLVLGRILSSSSEVHAASLPHPALPPRSADADAEEPVAVGPEGLRRPALTGAEISFPIQIPPVTLQESGRYNRPNFLNYYFSRTDLIRGPADPTCFCDELSLEAQDPGSEHVWTYRFTVATPSGLRQLMDQEKFASLFFDGAVVIVGRWDLPTILETVTEEIMKNYGHLDEEEEPAPGSDQ